MKKADAESWFDCEVVEQGATFYFVQCCENIVYEKGEVIDFCDCWYQEKPTKQPEATYDGLKFLRAFK